MKKSISAIKSELDAAQGAWNTDAYGTDGKLLDTIEGDELEGAGRIAILTKALADAERAAAAEKAAFDNAKARNAAAKKTLKAAADSVTQAQKDIVSRVKGAGDVSGVSTPPGFQREIGVKAQGSSRSMSEAGWPAAMASSVALR